MNKANLASIDTRCVHAGGNREGQMGVVTPIYPSTAFQHIDGDQQLYPRYFNTPNQNGVAEKICQLESAESAVVFSSGMAAISTTLLTLLQNGDHVVLLNGIYGGTHTFVTEEFERLGIAFSFARGIDGIRGAVNDQTKLIYVESPTNPLLGVIDLRAVVNIAKSAKKRVYTVIDNTFATPVNQRPMELGFDVSLHSGTKYLGGHSDLCCGAVVANRELCDRIRSASLKYGGSLNAITCYLLERSLKTLSIRVKKQSQNAMELAKFLEDLAGIKSVAYPGLSSHPDHEVAKSQMDGFGAMIAMELDVPSGSEAEAVNCFLNELEVIVPALSLGGVESTICVPALTSHRGIPAEERLASGLSDSMLRFSVGIEDSSDLMKDLRRAIAKTVVRTTNTAQITV